MSYGSSFAEIAAKVGVEPEKVCEIVQLALEEFHRQTAIGDKGPSDAVMEACFSFGAEAAFHLIGLFACFSAYRGNFDEAAIWEEVGMRLIPNAYQEGVDRIAPWFSERSPERLRHDEYIHSAQFDRT
ncbi:hypothetical protein [Microvirga sp. CF3016]|uniref:hypothetical protein n=1 Tax=Microvirga sp. CF3016 TaxID=3110181 RepID=UPI002E766584|nr:hypothetical protein [Microvirga sp. CF3016]MEE1614044.1 hypothetical protein [Microvirga sp. CF3016]